ncbi:MAG: PTS system, fructose-specific IIB component [Candidatus Carbobacillus altaicus]|uniref:PTS system, fructose-specific IIB component n=1 Tax=Candidatus Carbonibacillus altaicus TaxID=2163959 RepID=A0A2R6Y404_9BACL|nr:MAG: PTS system, fructose-specific IIB component [Candidatus Carbobacillus altaicus]
MTKLIAVTACPTGIAHTFMAAEALKKAAESKGIEMKVETHGAAGVGNALTAHDISEADAVILAVDIDVDEKPFAGKPIVRSSVGDAIKKPAQLIEQALLTATDHRKFEQVDEGKTADAYERVAQEKAKRQAERQGVYRHLMTGVSFMIPFVVAGGLSIALSFVFGIEAFKQDGTLAAALMQIGGGSAFALMVPVLAGYIAFSIADRPGLAPGMIGGLIAANMGAGFLGGLVAGFLAGYLTSWLNRNIRLPKSLEGIKPVLILPLLSTLVVGLGMIYVLGAPVKWLMDALTSWLTGLSGTNAMLLGLILGLMMAFDMGGPVNKAAYTFAVGLLGSQVYLPMAAVMAAGMTPPLGLWMATQLAPKRYTLEEREAGKAALFLGLSFITEGAIPFAAADPLRVIPSIMLGSGIAGALSMGFGVSLHAPHGGLFVLFIPHAVDHLLLYLVAIAVGTIVTAFTVNLLKAFQQPIRGKIDESQTIS